MINTLGNIINKAKQTLNKEYVLEEDLRYLLQETFSLSPSDFIISLDKKFEDEDFFLKWERANKGEPLYYILGKGRCRLQQPLMEALRFRYDKKMDDLAEG